MSLQNNEVKLLVIALDEQGYSASEIAAQTGIGKSTITDFLRKESWVQWWEDYGDVIKMSETIRSQYANVLVLDIETSQMFLGGWGLFNQNYSLEQIEKDWTLLSYSAKWVGEDEVFYSDVTEKTEDDLLSELHGLLDVADFVIAHNGRRFDMKKIKARMIIKGMQPFSPVRIIDTLEIAKSEFGFTSNKLQYLTDVLCKSKKKSAHAKFSGYLLWKEFLAGNLEAISEMREYNIMDVESLEELYFILAPWSNKLPNFDVYNDDVVNMENWEHVGYHCTNLGKYDKYRHRSTGMYRRGRKNLLSKEKREQLLANIA